MRARAFAAGALVVGAFASRATAQKNPTTIVHVDATNPNITLETAQKNGDWVTACAGACDRPLVWNATYRVSGIGIRDSDPFTFGTKPSQRVVVHADTKSSALHLIGVGLLALGIAAAGIGGFVTLFTLIGTISGPLDKGLLTAGLVTVGAGVVTLTPGIVFMAVSPSSTATITF